MIESIRVTGFRLLRDFFADLGPINVIIGANATGKSTLLDCLRMITRLSSMPYSDVFSEYGGIASLRCASNDDVPLSWTLIFRKPDTHPQWLTIPIPSGRALAYEVRFSADRDGNPLPIHEVLRNAESHAGYSEPFKFLDSSHNRSMIYDPRQKKLVPFDVATDEQTLALPFDESTETPTTGLSIPLPNDISSASLRLAQMRFFNEYPQQSWIRVLLSCSAFYPGFGVERFSALRCRPSEFVATTVLTENGDNLGAVLHDIFTRLDHRESAKNIRAFVRQAYSFVEDITAETTLGAPPKVQVYVRESGMNRPMGLWDLSDGMLRYLCLATALLSPSPAPFLFIDEPEVGFHPRLLPLIAEMVKTAGERTQVCINTHSPELVDCFDAEHVAVMTREGGNAAWHRPSSRKGLKRMLDVVGAGALGDLHRSGELEELD